MWLEAIPAFEEALKFTPIRAGAPSKRSEALVEGARDSFMTDGGSFGTGGSGVLFC